MGKTKIEVQTRIRPTIDGRLADVLSEFLSAGWELLSPPIFAGNSEPAGMNGYAVGFNHPHFLVIFRREVPVPDKVPTNSQAAPKAVPLGRARGVKARAVKLTPERRTEIAVKAAAARWTKKDRK